MIDADATHDRLAARIVRALTLARERVATADLLNFYADLCEYQQSLLVHLPRVVKSPKSGTFADAVDVSAISALAPPFVAWLDARPQRGLAAVSSSMRERSAEGWSPLLNRYCRVADVPRSEMEEADQFVVEALLQPFAESFRRAAAADDIGAVADGEPQSSRCRSCGRMALVATLRRSTNEISRVLTCGFCLSEWAVSHTVCPACGESDADARLVYRSEEFPDVRVDACRRCFSYVKSVDLTITPDANAVVDDLASLALDLWAAGRRYRKLRPNLLRL